MRFWALEKCKLLHVPNKWMDSGLISGRDIGTNECMDEMRGKTGRKCSSAPWLEPVKLEPAAETGCGSYSVPLSSFVLTSGF